MTTSATHSNSDSSPDQNDLKHNLALRVILWLHLALTFLYAIGHMCVGLWDVSNFSDFNLELVRIITSAAHVVCIYGILKFKKWAWNGYLFVWGVSLLLNLFLNPLDIVILVLYALIWIGIIYSLLRSGGDHGSSSRRKLASPPSLPPIDPVTHTSSLENELNSLKRLLDSNLLSEEEFISQKQEILKKQNS